ncbi:Rid family detoxifying hydrolase [Rhodococcus wratislaviensis]|uniref:Rid family detoxifying hydrolase n=1 Tax=Rhodococcus wratislaviensis TaxID=44752 RepID=UPI003514450C
MPTKFDEGLSVMGGQSSDSGPPLAPYTQVGEMIFVSGQVPIDPATGETRAGNIAVQTEQVLANLRGVVESAGATVDDIVKTTVFMTDISQLAEMNAAYRLFFSNTALPSRSAVQVAALARGDWQIEIEAVAIGAK